MSWVPKIQDVPFQVLVHYLKAARRHPGVLGLQVDEEIHRTVIRICEKVEQRSMVDLWRVFVDYNDRLHAPQNGVDITCRPRMGQMLHDTDRERHLDC